MASEAIPAPAEEGRNVQRFLLRLRSVLARNVVIEDGDGQRRQRQGHLPDCVFRILARAPGGEEPEVLHESTVCPNTMNPSWLVLDLDHRVLEARWKRVTRFTLQILEKPLADRLAITAPAPSAYELADVWNERPPRSAAPGEERRVLVAQEVNLDELTPLGCGVADLSSLPPNALLFSLRLDGSDGLETRDTEALFAPEWVYAALRRFGLIPPPRDALSGALAARILGAGGADAPAAPADEGAERAAALAAALQGRLEEVASLRREVRDRLRAGGSGSGSAVGSAGEEAAGALRVDVAEAEARRDAEGALLGAEEEALAEEGRQLEALMRDVVAEGGELERLRAAVEGAQDELARSVFLLEARQTRLLAELQGIYPLQQLSSGAWAIRGLELPRNAGHKDDEHVSSALGYVAHLALMLGKYLGVPLRYQILYYSSRSAIRDEVRDGASVSVNTFYLFRRGVERERFEAAVAMLQKNVEQILAARGLAYDAKQCMLANLHSLFAAELDPSMV